MQSQALHITHRPLPGPVLLYTSPSKRLVEDGLLEGFDVSSVQSQALHTIVLLLGHGEAKLL